MKFKLIVYLAFFSLIFVSFKPIKIDDYSLKIMPVKYVGKSLLLISTTLTNNTNDTLKFFNMSCMWQRIYSTDNPGVKIDGPKWCDGNFPVLHNVAPHKSFNKDFYVQLNENIAAKNEFKILMDLIQIKERDFGMTLGLDYNEIKNNFKSQVLHSNLITIKNQ